MHISDQPLGISYARSYTLGVLITRQTLEVLEAKISTLYGPSLLSSSSPSVLEVHQRVSLYVDYILSMNNT